MKFLYLTNHVKRTINTIIKVGILLCATVFIYYKLSNNKNLEDFERLIDGISKGKAYSILSLVFALMLLNWFLEALKWQFLVRPIKPISILLSVESVFCGLTLAVFTPNRIGEYGGRIFFLPARKRVFGAIAMGVGAIAQMVITNILGAVAMLWFIRQYLDLNILLYYGLCILAVIYCLFFLLLYFNISFLLAVLNSINFLKKFRRFFQILARYHLKELNTVLLYSALRFLVFTSQYCLIINLLVPEIALFQMIMMILILFFIQSALPSLDLFDVGIRAMIATYLFRFITANEVAIMAATASIWFVNLIIPAILGTAFVSKLNFFDNRRN